MPAEELALLGALIDRLSHGGDPEVEAALLSVPDWCNQIKAAWTQAAFLATTESGFQRYCAYQLDQLCQLSNQLDANSDRHFADMQPGTSPDRIIQEALMHLMDYLRDQPHLEFNLSLNSPFYWRRLQLRRAVALRNQVHQQLTQGMISSEVRKCIIRYLEEVDTCQETAFFSFHALEYWKQLLHRLNTVLWASPQAEARLHEVLIHINFNHLHYWLCRQQQLETAIALQVSAKEKLSILLAEQEVLMRAVSLEGVSCQPNWPPILTLLRNWIHERLALLERQERQEMQPTFPIQPEKVPLNLSVAHLAYLTRLFVEETHLGPISVTALLKFVAKHYQTKRQQAISYGSLSKEFYGTSQVTAAKVLAILEKMISRINRQFFPLLAAMYAITHV